MENVICLHQPEDSRNYYIFGYYGSLINNHDKDGNCIVTGTEIDRQVKGLLGDEDLYSDQSFSIDYADIENITNDPLFEYLPNDFPLYRHGHGELLAIGVYLDKASARDRRLYGIGHAVNEVESFLMEFYPDIVAGLSEEAQKALALLMVGEGYSMIGSLAATTIFMDSLREFIESDGYNPRHSATVLANSVYRERFDGRLPPAAAAAVGRAFDGALTKLWWAHGM